MRSWSGPSLVVAGMAAAGGEAALEWKDNLRRKPRRGGCCCGAVGTAVGGGVSVGVGGCVASIRLSSICIGRAESIAAGVEERIKSVPPPFRLPYQEFPHSRSDPSMPLSVHLTPPILGITPLHFSLQPSRLVSLYPNFSRRNLLFLAHGLQPF